MVIDNEANPDTRFHAPDRRLQQVRELAEGFEA